MNERKSSYWRNKMFKYAWLLQRGRCAKCEAEELFSWRSGGLNGGISSGNLHTIIWLVSNLELDHIKPLHLGGSNDYGNLQLLCVDCHGEKTVAERKERARLAREPA